MRDFNEYDSCVVGGAVTTRMAYRYCRDQLGLQVLCSIDSELHDFVFAWIIIIIIRQTDFSQLISSCWPQTCSTVCPLDRLPHPPSHFSVSSLPLYPPNVFQLISYHKPGKEADFMYMLANNTELMHNYRASQESDIIAPC